ncbi:multifunctional CCA addition/repair protein [Thiomicrospira sp. WB1]|uniref:multifunctional CCA addition/repair protein n=1 Tax=Thiomicrospira sp. WB1 TaxID=1685380 RepID=UPI000748AE86|nr:multifunctional CCA addition/repair protein [Thiomicrospira sp. WB1]KUJ71170.1 2', 3'-cyclic nucleotide 2'-phosphodiesterase [Thiomicrospira sp. WB1]
MNQGNVYLVGGAVRDRLLGWPQADRDWVVVGGTPEAMQAQGFIPVGKAFPVFLHPDTKEEYALARQERKTGLGYHGFEVRFSPDVTLEEDLLRRDLTINAMAQTQDGELVDPYGGQADLDARVLRHVSPAFAEDPLRVLRVARFAAKLAEFEFQLAEETRDLMCAISASGELSALTPERVWQEVAKALETARPRRFFEVLDDVGALSVLFPELAALKGVAQPERYHPEGDAWVHTKLVLDQACAMSDAIEVRWAALMHDVGKGLTPPEAWPKHHGHEQAGVPLVEALGQRYRLPKKMTAFAVLATGYHGLVHQGLDAQGEPALRPKTVMRVLTAAGALKQTQTLDDLLTVCWADARGRTGFESVAYPQREYWRQVREAVASVSPQPLLAKGYQGAALGEALTQERHAAIKTFHQHFSDVSI